MQLGMGIESWADNRLKNLVFLFVTEALDSEMPTNETLFRQRGHIFPKKW